MPDRIEPFVIGVEAGALEDRAAADLTGDERAALADLDERSRTGSGYSAIQGTRPQTIETC